MKHVRHTGFAMLLAVFLFAAIGAAVTTTLLMLSVSSIQTISEVQESLWAKQLATTCVEAGLQQIVASVTYIGTGSMTLGQGSCTWSVAQYDSASDVVKGIGIVGTTTRRVKVIILVPQRSILTWQEVSDF